MKSAKKIVVYRWIEWLLLLVLLGAGVVDVYGVLFNTNPPHLWLGVTGVVSLILIIIIRLRIDRWLDLVVAQSEFTKNSSFTIMYERSPVAYIKLNKQGKVIDSNPAAINLLETDTEHIAEVHLFSLLETTENFDPSVLVARIRSGVTVNDVQAPMRTVKGGEIWVLLSSHEQSRSEELLVSLVDISDQKKIDTAKTEFVALATHQLRTPIAAIRWNAELLRKKMSGEITEAQDRYLTKVERNTARMNDLINDFLSVSKLELGTFATEHKAFDFDEFLDGVADEFTNLLSKKQIELHQERTPAGMVLKTDPRLLHIVVSNLLSNAVKYSKTGGNVWLRYACEQTGLRIEVADDGIGISEEAQRQLFRKFFRADNAKEHHAEGTGLGLYAVKQSVELLRGIITVESTENEGTRFVVTLPPAVVIGRKEEVDVDQENP